jgi:hypothetical protein
MRTSTVLTGTPHSPPGQMGELTSKRLAETRRGDLSFIGPPPVTVSITSEKPTFPY